MWLELGLGWGLELVKMHVEFYVFGLLQLQVLETQPMQTVTMDLRFDGTELAVLQAVGHTPLTQCH